MELHKQTEQIEYASKSGMSFAIRAQATRGDKYEMNAAMFSGKVSEDGKTIETTAGRLYPWLIQRFVVSCNKISGFGPDILKTLMDQDADPDEDLIMVLGAFIFTHVKGLNPKKSDEAKKRLEDTYEWILEGNDFGECRRTLCPKVVPCTFEGCNRPALDPWVQDILMLYQDCKQRNALPSAGGVMDQPEDIMMWFRVLDEKSFVVKRRHDEEIRRQNARYRS